MENVSLDYLVLLSQSHGSSQPGPCSSWNYTSLWGCVCVDALVYRDVHVYVCEDQKSISAVIPLMSSTLLSLNQGLSLTWSSSNRVD